MNKTPSKTQYTNIL